MHLEMSQLPASQLDLETRKALGRTSPQLAWTQIQTQVANAIQHDRAKAEKELQEAEYPASLDNLHSNLAAVTPERGISLFHESNPDLSLSQLPKMEPLKVLKAVLNSLMNNEKWDLPKSRKRKAV